MRRGVTIHHNGPPARCIGKPHSRCLAFWEAVRRFHTDPEPQGKDWTDIAYSFGVCPHGERLVGRGWDKTQWANGGDQVGADDGPDREWYTVLVFVGGDDSTGDNETPTPQMVAATRALIAEGRSSGRCGNRVLPHNAFKRKPCPGPEFTALAKAWDNATLTIPPEDDMNDTDWKTLDSKLAKLKADLQGYIAGAVKQEAKKVLLGGESSIFDPKAEGNTWMLTSPTLAGVLAAAIGQPPATVDVDALAVALGDKLDGLEAEELKAALREVFADAGSVG